VPLQPLKGSSGTMQKPSVPSVLQGVCGLDIPSTVDPVICRRGRRRQPNE